MGKTVLITGGTSGIGRAIAERIMIHSEEIDKIIVNYAGNEERANDFLHSFTLNKQKKLLLIKADLSDYEEMRKFVDHVKENTGQLDWVVCNVGITTMIPFDDYTYEEWSKIVNTNLSIPAFMVKELKSTMKSGGSILFMGSYAGVQTYSSSVVYGVTKAAVHFLAKSLVKVFEENAVRINAIAPGFIQTPWQNNRSAESYDRINRKIALHKFGEAKDVADMAYAILDNQYMNGSVVEIHGGYDYF